MLESSDNIHKIYALLDMLGPDLIKEGTQINLEPQVGVWKDIFGVNPKRNCRIPFRLVPIRNNVTSMFSPLIAFVRSVQFASACAYSQDKHDGAAKAVGSRLLLPYMH